MPEICETSLLETFIYLNRKGTNSIWVRLKRRETELKQWFKVSLANFVAMLQQNLFACFIVVAAKM